MFQSGVIAVLLSLAAQGLGEDCSTCEATILKLGEHFTKPEVIELEKVIFKSKICGEDKECVKFVEEKWGIVANAIFKHADTPKNMCSAKAAAPMCKQPATDCLTCSKFLNLVKALYNDAEYIQAVEGRLGGPLFCDTQGSEKETCKAFVTKYTKTAMPVVGAAIFESKNKVCGFLIGGSC